MLLAVIATLFYYGISQQTISIENGHPYDSQVYFNMAKQVAAGLPVSELRPFTYRIGLPYIVGSLFPDNIAMGFTLLNLSFAFLTAMVLFLFARSFDLSRVTSLFIVLCFVCAPQSPARFTHFIPAYTDPSALFFIMFFLYLLRITSQISFRGSLLISLIALLGVLFRELSICGVLIFVFGKCFRLQGSLPFLSVRSWSQLGICLIPLAVSCVAIILVHQFVDGTGDYAYIRQMGAVFSGLIRRPDVFVLSWFTSFGVIPLILLVFARRPLMDFLARHQFVGVYLFGCVLLALLTGFHTDRIVFWSFPAVLLLFGVVIEARPFDDHSSRLKLAFYAPLIFGQVLAWRAWLPIPDDPGAELFNPGAPPVLLFSAYGDVSLGHIYASTLPLESRLMMLGQYLALGLYFWLLVRRGTRRQSATSDIRPDQG